MIQSVTTDRSVALASKQSVCKGVCNPNKKRINDTLSALKQAEAGQINCRDSFVGKSIQPASVNRLERIGLEMEWNGVAGSKLSGRAVKHDKAVEGVKTNLPMQSSSSLSNVDDTEEAPIARHALYGAEYDVVTDSRLTRKLVAGGFEATNDDHTEMHTKPATLEEWDQNTEAFSQSLIKEFGVDAIGGFNKPSYGLHIHVDIASGFKNPKAFAHFLCTLFSYSKELAKASRVGGDDQFCESLTNEQVLSVSEFFNSENLAEGENLVDMMDRLDKHLGLKKDSAVNLKHSNFGTVELRFAQSPRGPKDISTWIKFIDKIVKSSHYKKGVDFSAKPSNKNIYAIIDEVCRDDINLKREMETIIEAKQSKPIPFVKDAPEKPSSRLAWAIKCGDTEKVEQILNEHSELEYQVEGLNLLQLSDMYNIDRSSALYGALYRKVLEKIGSAENNYSDKDIDLILDYVPVDQKLKIISRSEENSNIIKRLCMEDKNLAVRQAANEKVSLDVSIKLSNILGNALNTAVDSGLFPERTIDSIRVWVESYTEEQRQSIYALSEWLINNYTDKQKESSSYRLMAESIITEVPIEQRETVKDMIKEGLTVDDAIKYTNDLLPKQQEAVRKALKHRYSSSDAIRFALKKTAEEQTEALNSIPKHYPTLRDLKTESVGFFV